MYNREMNKKEHTPWLSVVMLAPVTQTASGCSWVAAAVVVLLCLSISFGMEKIGAPENTGRWLGAIQWLWMLLVISEFMHWAKWCWPADGTESAVSLVLLALAAYTAAKGMKTASRAGTAMSAILLLLFGAVLLSGIKEVKLENLMPQWEMQTANLITAMLIPVMGACYGPWENKKRVFFYSVFASVVCTGVLSLQYLRNVNAPFYELGRSITLLGVGQRFESLVAAGMTLGYYALLTYLIGITAKAWEPGGRRARSIWISALFTAAVFISGMRMNSRLLAIGNLVIWVILPLLKIIAKKMKKTIDK